VAATSAFSSSSSSFSATIMHHLTLTPSLFY
jgi:hypothetical protein